MNQAESSLVGAMTSNIVPERIMNEPLDGLGHGQIRLGCCFSYRTVRSGTKPTTFEESEWS